jgi:hypothetical protein
MNIPILVRRMKIIVVQFVVLLLVGCDTVGPPSPSIPPTLTSIQTNVFDGSCANGGCHSGQQPAALLDLSKGNAYISLLIHRIENDTGRKYFQARVAPGRPDSSFIMAKLNGMLTPDEGDQMPQRLNKLPQYQIDAIRQWIQNGALNN